MNDYQLDQIALSYATEIQEEIKEYGGEETILAHERADGSEHVIYTYKAAEICRECDVSSGEDALNDYGAPEGGWTFDKVVTTIAFWELETRILVALSNMED
mgnify:FL=1|tara:strand:+ start:997 stop:1302 length:306 start_codon:yes stop_codon:yes gene_type:complete